ncbi:MAG: hypothetical protein R3F65_05805 [bacterium]|nr:hypothetical protein [Myxococcales bacterium]MCB9543138.1 hypothetical protein [Myxococcales bacterium]MCB9552342.1 hypothetical protein [Myxococcales bacterium]
MAWLEALHAVATTTWAGGLVAVAILDRRRPVDAPRALYRRLVAPAAFLALLTGIAWLHDDPRRLRAGIVIARLTTVGLLLAVDAACQRGLGRRTPLLAGAAVALGATHGALGLATPGGA